MKKISENFLEKIPVRNEDLRWSIENETVTLEIDNKGMLNKMAQKLLKKPKVTYIHLDDMGSFIWPVLDGEKNLIEIGELVEERFGEKANPLYERLAQYFKILESYGFILWVE